jgi:hypothetical protein
LLIFPNFTLASFRNFAHRVIRLSRPMDAAHDIRSSRDALRARAMIRAQTAIMTAWDGTN